MPAHGGYRSPVHCSKLTFLVGAFGAFALACGSNGAGPTPSPDGGASDNDAGSPGIPTPDAGIGDVGPASDGGTDAQPAGDAAPHACGTSEWPTYGHDPQRTGASDGCISGPLTAAWTYLPAPSTNDLATVNNLVTAAGALFLHYTAGYGPELDGLTTAGKKNWSWAAPGGRDIEELHWPTVAMGSVLLEDDGLYVVDASKGTTIAGTSSYDDWGQNTADGTRFYVNSDVNSPDGPGLYIGAYDAKGMSLWQTDSYKMCGTAVSETYGSIALDGGKVFRSGVYTSGSALASGLVSYDPSSGARGWAQTTTPQSAVSAGGGLLFVIEQTNSGSALVARKESDGSVAWTQAVSSPSVQAPVVANNLVIVATKADVRAFAASTGTPGWTATLSAPVNVNSFSDGFTNCATPIAFGSLPYTSLAAALGSNSLIVTATDAIHVLSLTDGSDTWHGTPTMVKGPVQNPVIVGHTLYVVDLGVGKTGQLVALTSG
jgi:hypothetical protein